MTGPPAQPYACPHDRALAGPCAAAPDRLAPPLALQLSPMAAFADCFVTLLLPGGVRQTVGPGALFGRSFAADVRLDDGRISEAHAFLSLRGGQFVLFALRGRLRVDGRDVLRVELCEGQLLELARDFALEVERVVPPRRALAVCGVGLEQQILVEVTSLILEPVPHLVAGHQPRAAAVLFSDGLEWRLQAASGELRTLAAGETITVQGCELSFADQWLGDAQVEETAPLVPSGALRLVSYFDSVHLLDENGEVQGVLTGKPAQLMAELLAYGGPIEWRALAHALWGKGEQDQVLRNRLDVTLAKLRRLLKAIGLRRDLVLAHKNGLLELVLYPGDKTEDRG